MFKNKEVIALFVSLVIVLAISPRFVYTIYQNVIGKLVLLIILSFLAMKNITLGLLFALCLIVLSTQYGNITEGMDNIQIPGTIGEDNTTDTSGNKIQLATKQQVKENVEQKISDLKAKIQNSGLNVTAIEDSIRAKASQTIPIDKQTTISNENVSPFTSGMLTNGTSLTEGFCPCAASI
uniref:Uncharacterized protein n=1 Tax=viral metagenome TaxID=1070528 RepID=A0A6C0IUE1_9ZZZZ